MAYIDMGRISLTNLAIKPTPITTTSIASPLKPTTTTKAKKKGLAIAAAKKAASLMRKGEKLDAAWAKAGGEQDVLAKIKQMKVPGLGSISTNDLTDIANAAISTMKGILGPTTPTTPTTRVVTPNRNLPKVNVPQNTDAGLYEVVTETQKEGSKTALLLAGAGGLGLLALLLMKRKR